MTRIRVLATYGGGGEQVYCVRWKRPAAQLYQNNCIDTLLLKWGDL